MEALLDPKLQQYEVGDTVAIRYTATSTAGVWRSAVALAGAFEQQQVFSERGSSSVQRTAKFVVPAGARLDEPLHISVYAEDVGLQVAARHLPAAARIVDVTPPTLTSMTVYSGSWIDRRQAAVGDEIRLVAAARDDHALTWLVYELGAPANVRDSVPLAAGGASSDTWTAILTAKPEWLGAFPLSAYVRDAAGHRSEVLDAGELRVYPVVERATSGVLDVPTGFAPAIEDVAYDAGRDLMYLAQPGTRSVQRLVVGAMAFDAPLTFDERLGGVALALSADSLLVTLPESRRIAVLHVRDGQRTYVALSVLDTAGTDGSVSPLPPQPTSVRVTASGKALVPLTHGTRSNVHVLEVDLATGAHRLRPDAGARGFGQYHASARFGLTPDRSRLVMLPAYACAQVYIAVSDSFTPCSPPIDAYPGLSFMSFDAVGAQLTFANRVLDASLREVRQVPMRFSPPSPISLSGGGEVVYVPTSGGIDVMRIADGIFVERITVPVEVSRLFVAPDGSWLIAFTDSMEPKLVRVSLR
jgi:hypothetical protein